MKIKRYLGMILVIGVFALAGCQSKEEVNQTKKESVVSSEVENDNDLASKLLKLVKETPSSEKNTSTKKEKLRTSSNGVEKYVGMSGDEIEVGYKEYEIPESWTLDNSRTVLEDVDVVWQNMTKYPYYYQMYMLPTYKGSIANLEAKRLTENDLETILKEDKLDFIKTEKIEIDGLTWLIGIEIHEADGACRISFSHMEEAKGSFSESVIVSNLVFGMEPVRDGEKEAVKSLEEQISIQKKVLSSFSETKTETISVE